MPDTENTRRAREHIDRLRELEAEVTTTQRARNAAILAMIEDDGMKPPEVGRALGMSASNVRLIELKARADRD